MSKVIAFSPARDMTMTSYAQLTYEQRCQIYALKKSALSQQDIIYGAVYVAIHHKLKVIIN